MEEEMKELNSSPKYNDFTTIDIDDTKEESDDSPRRSKRESEKRNHSNSLSKSRKSTSTYNSALMRDSNSKSSKSLSIPLSMYERRTGTSNGNSRTTSLPIPKSKAFTFRGASKGIWKQFKTVMSGKTFYVSAILSLALAGLVSLSLVGSLPLFRFLAVLAAGIICIEIFTMLCFSQITGHIDGFFLVVGFGYGYVGVLTVLTRAAQFGLFPADLARTSVFSLDLFARYNELAAIFIGLFLSFRIFRGVLPMIITFFLFLFVNAMLFCSLYWWRTYPASFASGEATAFYINHQYAFIALFVLAIPLLFITRRNFSTNVFVFVSVALLLRAVATVFTALLAATTADWPVILSNLLRIISFLFLFISLTISTLKNPMETLFKNLNVKHTALQDERVVINWMIEQVPAIALLITDEGIIQHINKFGAKSLDCARRNLIDTNFFSTFAFEDLSTEDAMSQFKNQSQNKNNEMIMLRSNKMLCNGESLENHIIEWTFKPMTSSSSLSFSGKETTADSDGLSSSRSEGSSKKSSEAKSQSMGSKSFASSNEDEDEDEVVATTWLCLGRDITDKHEREKLLNEARVKAEKASIMKDTFVANVSHELRTPLNCIVGVTDLFQQMALPENQQEMVQMIKGAANSLLTLISDILDFAKLRQGQMKLTYSSLDLYKFVETSVASTSILFSNNLDFGYRIHKNCPKIIYNDETRLRQVLFNLFSNSIKFTKEGQVVLKIQMSEELIGGVPALQFEVIDSGIGIDETDVKKLFERFFQTDQGENKKPGTGIGLAITKQIVELMGGKISVTSERGVGTTMRFLIPSRKISIKSSVHQDSNTPISPTSNDTPEKKTITWENEAEGSSVESSVSTPANLPVEDQVSSLTKSSRNGSRAGTLRETSMGAYTEEFEYQPVLVCLKNQVVAEMLTDSLSLDHSIDTTNLNGVPALMNYLLKEYAPNLVPEFKVPESKVPTFTSPNLPVPSTPDIPAPSGSPDPILPAFAVPNFQISKKIAVVTVVIELEFLSQVDWNSMKKIHNPQIHLIVVLPSGEVTLPPAFAGLEKEFKVDIIRKMIQQSLLIKIIRRGQRKLMIEQLDSMKLSGNSFKEGMAQRMKNQLITSAIVSSDEEGNKPIPPVSNTSLDILVVEDNKTNQRVMQLMLDRIGSVKYEFASNGREAVDKLAERMKGESTYDCVFMDIQMPILDGIAATEEIRKMEKETGCPPTHITALTANALQEERDKCSVVGMDDYLTKPVSLQTFTTKMNNLRITKDQKAKQ